MKLTEQTACHKGIRADIYTYGWMQDSISKCHSLTKTGEITAVREMLQ